MVLYHSAMRGPQSLFLKRRCSDARLFPRLLLSDSFMSQTKQHYQPPIHSDGSGSLPSVLNKPRASGFHHVRSLSKAEPVEAKSEYQSFFVPHHLTPSVSHHMKLGPKVETGFTKGTNLQLNTFHDKRSCIVSKLFATLAKIIKSEVFICLF
ncbi:hypothetical protein AMECASPLE_037873 [Ameca splendens]|uniref:Uncharacterized protein n=1 Tax=Ameca splendens TaxID=208324 RepID=A0ABV1AEF0_9TELE